MQQHHQYEIQQIKSDMVEQHEKVDIVISKKILLLPFILLKIRTIKVFEIGYEIMSVCKEGNLFSFTV